MRDTLLQYKLAAPEAFEAAEGGVVERILGLSLNFVGSAEPLGSLVEDPGGGGIRTS